MGSVLTSLNKQNEEVIILVKVMGRYNKKKQEGRITSEDEEQNDRDQEESLEA